MLGRECFKSFLWIIIQVPNLFDRYFFRSMKKTPCINGNFGRLLVQLWFRIWSPLSNSDLQSLTSHRHGWLLAREQRELFPGLPMFLPPVPPPFLSPTNNMPLWWTLRDRAGTPRRSDVQQVDRLLIKAFVFNWNRSYYIDMPFLLLALSIIELRGFLQPYKVS